MTSKVPHKIEDQAKEAEQKGNLAQAAKLYDEAADDRESNNAMNTQSGIHVDPKHIQAVTHCRNKAAALRQKIEKEGPAKSSDKSKSVVGGGAPKPAAKPTPAPWKK